MDMQLNNINNLSSVELYKYSTDELIYTYLSAFQIQKSNDYLDESNHKSLHVDFLDFIKNTNRFIDMNYFIDKCRWYSGIIPIHNDKLPLFSYYSKPITNTIPKSNINILQLYEVIKNPKYFEKKTFELRNIKDSKQKRKYKTTNFDFVLFHGIFQPTKRNSQNCNKLSGYLCVDIDHVQNDINELKTRLINDSTLDVQLMFVSPSGDGLKVVIPYDIIEFTIFEDVFFEAEKYFFDTFSIKIDDKCKNIDRACFLCHDNEVFINPKILS